MTYKTVEIRKEVISAIDRAKAIIDAIENTPKEVKPWD